MEKVLQTDGDYFARCRQMEREKFKDDPEMLAILDAEEKELEEEDEEDEE